MTIRLIVAAITVSIMTGCASTRQFVRLPDQSKTVEDTSKARIYVVRPSVLGAAISMKVTDGEQEIGKTGGKGYLCWERMPGETTLKSKAENTATLPLKTEAGTVYYVQQQIRMGVLKARNKLSILEEQDGKEALTKCNPPQTAE